MRRAGWSRLALWCVVLAAPVAVMSCTSQMRRRDKKPWRPAKTAEETAWAKTLEERLKEPVSFDFKATPLDDVVGFLRSLKQLNFVIDRTMFPERGNLEWELRKKKVTLQLNRAKLKDAIDHICTQAGAGYVVADSAIFIATKDRLRELAKAKTVLYNEKGWTPMSAVMAEPVSFDFRATPLKDVAAFLRNLTKANIIVDERAVRARKDLDVTLHLEKVDLKTALKWVCRLMDLAYTVRDEAIYITTRRHLVGLEKTVVYDPEAWKPFKAALNERVSMDFVATPLDDVVAFLRNLKKVNIVVDRPALAGRDDLDVTLELEKTKLKYALAWVCRLLDLGYAVKSGAVFISTPDRLPPPPKPKKKKPVKKNKDAKAPKQRAAE